MGGSADEPAIEHSPDPEQLAADAKIWNLVAQAGFAGPRYDRFVDMLIRNALPTFRTALRTGRVFEQCRRRNPRIRLHAPRHWSHDDREDLAWATLASALHRFARDAKADHGWSDQGGATLSTYFYGFCLDAFPNQFRAWLRQTRSLMNSHTALSDVEDIATTADPEDEILLRLELRQRLSALGPRQRDALLLSIEGYTNNEIGEILGSTARAAEALIHRARRRIHRQPARGGSDG